MVVGAGYLQSILSQFIFAPFTESFYSKFILISRYPFLNGTTLNFFILLILFTIGSIYFRPISWKEIPKPIYYTVICCQIILLWAFSFYEFNYYFDTWHLVERIILVGLFMISLYNPYFSIFFLIQAIILSKQFSFPSFLIYSFSDKEILFDSLSAFWIFLFIKPFFSKIKWETFFVLVFAIIGNWYLLAGIGKLSLDWHSTNSIYNLFAAAYQHGWLHSLSLDALLILSDLLEDYNHWLQVGALIIELVIPLSLVIHYRITIIGLIGYLSFHSLVFLTSGIFFWKWIILELVLIGIIWCYRRSVSQIYTSINLVTYLLLLSFGSLLFSNTKLAWIDTGFINHYQFFLIDKDEKRHGLDASFFSPYDLPFAQNRFHFIKKEKHMVDTYGGCNKCSETTLEFIKNWENTIENRAQFRLLKAKYGNTFYHQKKQQQFYSFLKTFVNNKLRNDKKLISYIDPPMHIHQGENQQNYKVMGTEPIEKLEIVYQEKILKEQLQFDLISSDTISINL